MITILTQYFLSDHPWLLPSGFNLWPSATLHPPPREGDMFLSALHEFCSIGENPTHSYIWSIRSPELRFVAIGLSWYRRVFHKPLPKFHLCCVVELSRLTASSETIGVCNAGNGTWCLRRISVLPDHFWQGFLAAIRVEPGHDLVRLTGCCD